MIKVLLADDHKIVREGLRRIIEESGEMTVVAEASDGNETIQKTLKFKPDVAVVDIAMPPGMDGLEVVSRLKSHLPDLPVLILTMHDEDQYVVRAIEAGAMGYVTKQSAPEQLVDAVRKLWSGGRYLTEKASEALALRVVRGDSNKSAAESLSMRELQVLRKLALGQTNHEIAESYNISVKTVDTYRSRILKKLNLRNNAELSRFAIQNKIIDL
ncbi:Two component transcriptional regulator (LuxR family protein) [Desulfamplus magnetovallimortis]|uniref:Two component transcriptional regulator (LuxR family protein) n=1 Tax=Desulfamplus magnetovallimortis TaxID=1246637 RepID=A0A1W1HDB9_9BACT|nr:response regulator transcription factor [Desulfamplus magnetovallimortis]SLM30470.1 Two component transcriptional regulator (LuxR family protein) [Desulfamplus magnetovallimortis]